MVPAILSGLSRLLVRGGDWLRRLFTSVRLAFFLILILAGLSLVGALLVQVPPEVVADPLSYKAWLGNVAQPRFGQLTGLLAFLQLFDIFHSIWFAGAGILLSANVLVCSLNRLFTSLGRVRESPVRSPKDFYMSQARRAEIACAKKNLSEATGMLSRVLVRHHYRLRQENAENATYLAAGKNQLSGYGTYLNHLSLIMVIAGYLLGSALGFRNPAFIVAEGEVREIGYDTGLALKLESFIDEYWEDGTPKDYRSEVVLYEEGKEIKRGVIRVNHPLGYGGVRFYQSFFGMALSLEVKPDTGEVLYQGNVPLSGVMGDPGAEQRVGSLPLDDRGLVVYLVARVDEKPPTFTLTEPINLVLYDTVAEAMVAGTELVTGVPGSLENLEFTLLGQAKFSGFQVSRDPGTVLIWLASGLFLLGTGLIFYLPHSELRALVETGASGSKIFLAVARGRGFGLDAEFRQITRELESG